MFGKGPEVGVLAHDLGHEVGHVEASAVDHVPHVPHVSHVSHVPHAAHTAHEHGHVGRGVEDLAEVAEGRLVVEHAHEAAHLGVRVEHDGHGPHPGLGVEGLHEVTELCAGVEGPHERVHAALGAEHPHEVAHVGVRVDDGHGVAHLVGHVHDPHQVPEVGLCIEDLDPLVAVDAGLESTHHHAEVGALLHTGHQVVHQAALGHEAHARHLPFASFAASRALLEDRPEVEVALLHHGGHAGDEHLGHAGVHVRQVLDEPLLGDDHPVGHLDLERHEAFLAHLHPEFHLGAQVLVGDLRELGHLGVHASHLAVHAEFGQDTGEGHAARCGRHGLGGGVRVDDLVPAGADVLPYLLVGTQPVGAGLLPHPFRLADVGLDLLEGPGPLPLIDRHADLLVEGLEHHLVEDQVGDHRRLVPFSLLDSHQLVDHLEDLLTDHLRDGLLGDHARLDHRTDAFGDHAQGLDRQVGADAERLDGTEREGPGHDRGRQRGVLGGRRVRHSRHLVTVETRIDKGIRVIAGAEQLARVDA